MPCLVALATHQIRMVNAIDRWRPAEPESAKPDCHAGVAPLRAFDNFHLSLARLSA
jgi:hypothetical protein